MGSTKSGMDWVIFTRSSEVAKEGSARPIILEATSLHIFTFNTSAIVCNFGRIPFSYSAERISSGSRLFCLSS